MTRKEQFLRAMQLLDAQQHPDLPLAFRWALNLSEQGIPHDMKNAAQEFATRISMDVPEDGLC